MFGTLGIWEILLIFGILVLLFGARKLPEIGKGLGKAISNFKRGIKAEPRKIENEQEEGEPDETEASEKSSEE